MQKNAWKTLAKLWPVPVAVAVGYFLDVDVSVIPALRLRGYSVHIILALAILAGCSGAFWWWWFFGWVGRQIAELKVIRDEIKWGKEVVEELKSDPLFWRLVGNVKQLIERYKYNVLHHIITKYEWATHKDNKVFKTIKYGGCASMIPLGFLPIPGTRVGATIYCRIFNQKLAFAILLISDSAHIVYMVGLWKFIFYCIGW